MHRSFYSLAAGLIAVAAASVSNAVIGAVAMARGAVDQFFDALMSMVPAGPKLVLAGSFRLDRDARGAGLDPALQNDLRHEAGVSRRSAERFV